MAKSLPYAGVNFKWNIQDVFSNRQVVSQRQFQQLQAEENNQYTKQQTTVSVEKAYRKLKQAEDLIAVAQKAVSYRKAQLKIESDKNEVGIGQAIDVLETEAELAKSRTETAARLADAERRAQSIIEQAKASAVEEGNKIVAAARAEAEQQTIKARDSLRDQVAALAVKGAEQILRKEVNAGVHADLLGRLKTEL